MTSFAAVKPSIVVIGDSLSAGYGIAISKGWVDLLKQRLIQQHYDYQVVNASISGDTTSNVISRLPDLIQDYPNAIYILELGGNDGLQGIQVNTIENNIAKIIELIQKKNNKLILLGIRIPSNYGVQYTQSFQHIYPSLAKKYHVLLVPIFLKGIDLDRGLMQPDGIHPTEQAQSIMLDNVWVELKKVIKK